MDLIVDETDYETLRHDFDKMLDGRHIANLSLKHAMDMAKEIDVVGYKQAKSLAEVHRCLKIHLLKVKQMEKRGHEPLKVFSRLRKHYQMSCEKLSEIIVEFLDKLNKVEADDPLIGDLEKSIPGFKFPQTLLEHKEKLLNPECKILVTGELCAGKTSVVNTLLEEKVLPDNFLSNTLTLCELKYGPKRGAKVHPWQTDKPIILVTDSDEFLKELDRKKEIDYVPDWFNQRTTSDVNAQSDGAVGGALESDDSITENFEVVRPKETGPRPLIIKVAPEEFLQTVAKYIEEKDSLDQNNKRGRYKKVEVFLPNELLKDGLTIIDSPGIGDSPRLTDIVIENLVSAFGFIYVINSNARGGVQEDRLQVLLKKVRALESIDNQKLFSHESAIFVCNQWDKIPVTEHERLLNDTEKKLKKCWSGLQPEQIIPFSAKEAAEIYDEGYMTLEYRNLLDGIEDLIPVGLENKIFMSFKYLAATLQRLLRQLDGYLNHLHSTEEERKKRFNELHKRLENLKNLSRRQFKELRTDVDNKLKDVHTKLREHIMEETTMKRLCQWTMDEAPGKVYNFDEVYMHIQKKMTERITAEIGRWEEDNQFFEKVPDSIGNKFRSFFGKVEREMEEIQDKITNVRIEVINPEAWKKRDKLDLSPLLMYEKFTNAVKNPAKAVLASFLLPIVVPIAVVAAIPALVAFGAMAAKGMLTDSQKQTYLSEYSNPKTCQACLRKHSKKFLEFYCKSKEHLLGQLKEMMKPAYDIVDDLEIFIPQLIESDNQQVLSLMNDKRQAEEILKFYPSFRELMSDFRKRLHHFQVHYMKRNSRDVAVHNFIDTKVIDDQPICSGWFTSLHCAQLTTRKGRHSHTESVSMRCIKKPVREKDVGGYLAEEECWVIKPLREKNIAKFIGLTVENSETIYHIVEQMTGNLRARLRSESLGSDPKTFMKKNTVVGDIAKQIATGLKYIHDKNLVYFDLSLDTVGYKIEGTTMVVKLTNMSTQKHIILDPEMKKEELKLYRYLPWDVLNGQKYTKESDMYSFGLMLWEMITSQVAFETEFHDRPIDSLESLMKCIEYGRPKVTSSLSLSNMPSSDFDQTWESLMCSLWDNRPSERPSVQRFLRILSEPGAATGLPIYADHFSAT